MWIRRGESGLIVPTPGIEVARTFPATLGGPGENFLLRASLQCYYKFENGSDLGEDYKGNIALTNNNGVTQSATVPSGTYAAPTAQNSADFEQASSQYLSATHDASAEIDNLSAITFVAWVKAESWTGSSGDCLFYCKGDSTTGHYFGYFTSGTDGVRLNWQNNKPQKDVVLSTAVWYFLAFTYSQVSDAIRFYKGDEENQVAQLGTDVSAVDVTAATTGAFDLGRYTGGSHYCDCLICEPAWFSEELTLANLQELQQYGMDGSG